MEGVYVLLTVHEKYYHYHGKGTKLCALPCIYSDLEPIVCLSTIIGVGEKRRRGRIQLKATYIVSFSTLQSWKRLGVVESHLDLLRHFPPHFRFVLLQHSPDRYVQTGSNLLYHVYSYASSFRPGLSCLQRTLYLPSPLLLLPRRDNLHHKLVGTSGSMLQNYVVENSSKNGVFLQK